MNSNESMLATWLRVIFKWEETEDSARQVQMRRCFFVCGILFVLKKSRVQSLRSSEYVFLIRALESSHTYFA